MENSYVDFEPSVQDTQGAATSLKDQASETAGRGREKAEEVLRNVQGKFDRSRRPAADNLGNAASALHRRADKLPGGENVAKLAHRAADRMQITADYIRAHDAGDMMGDVKGFLGRHPGGSLAAAAVIGFFIGRKLRSGD
jgi:ElaB/YqjD/DUF883 family membrane-anchored ribosome-binding protein